MSVWFAIPSKRSPVDAMTVLQQWHGRGYKVAVYRDRADEPLPVDMCVAGDYEGYPQAVNYLARQILQADSEAEWIVTGGDDILPDMYHAADQVGHQCTTYFKGTLGVMQPTGDRFMEEPDGTCAAERVCVSPWMGREWCQRGYNGNGPMCETYFHFFVDEDMQHVLKRDGLLWHRLDLNQHHGHWCRHGGGRPEHLNKAQLQWAEAKALFAKRKAAGFPGSKLA